MGSKANADVAEREKKVNHAETYKQVLLSAESEKGDRQKDFSLTDERIVQSGILTKERQIFPDAFS